MGVGRGGGQLQLHPEEEEGVDPQAKDTWCKDLAVGLGRNLRKKPDLKSKPLFLSHQPLEINNSCETELSGLQY